MTENNSLLSGITRIAWGFVFILFNFSINEIDLIPDFIGYISVAMGIVCLGDILGHLKLLKPLSVILSVWTAIMWFSEALTLTSLLSAGYASAVMGYLSTAMQVVVLIFTIALLTDLSTVAVKHQKADGNLDRKLIVARNIYAVCYSVNIGMSLAALLTKNVYPSIFTGLLTALSIASAIVMFVTMIIILIALFSLRKTIKDSQTATLSATYNIPPFETEDPKNP